ncbi:hypothetical protein, partial [Methylobacterium sp. WL30]|uniref:hypothetical protein n=1 Tax=Methylobacterium sp. WL30 TaxID=2603895 RepID=UPI00164EFA88
YLPPTSPAAAPAANPLTWWRSLPPEALDLPAQRRLRAVLVAAPPLPLPGWDAATEADPAAAIAVAIATLAEGVAHLGRLDPALSVVVLCAALGDPACRDLLVHVLGRRARRRADLDLLRLARAWRDGGRRETDPTFAPGR